MTKVLEGYYNKLQHFNYSPKVEHLQRFFDSMFAASDSAPLNTDAVTTPSSPLIRHSWLLSRMLAIGLDPGHDKNTHHDSINIYC